MKFSGRERRAKGRVRLLGACGSVELSEVASGSAMRGLWLGNGKVRSQVNGIDPSRFPGKRQLWKLGEEKDESVIERRGECTDLGLHLGEREKQVACHASALAMTDEAR